MDVVKEAEATEGEDIRRSYRLRLIIHGLSELSEGATVAGVEFPVSGRLKILLQFNC